MWWFHFKLPEVKISRSLKTSVLGKNTLFILNSNVGIDVVLWVFKTWHLLGFMFNFLSLTNCRFYLKSFVKQMNSLNIFVSSAKSLMLLLESTFEAISFMYIINKSGPITPPWGTPLKTCKGSENVLTILLFWRNFLNHSTTFLLILY